MEDVHPKLVDFLEGEAEGSQLTAQQLRASLERQMGLDLSEIDDDDAETFVDSLTEDGDVDAAIEVLEKYDVPDDVIAQARQMWNEEAQGGEPRGNGETPPSGGEGGDSEYLTRDEAEAMIPSADEIAAKLRSQMGGGGGGGGQQAPQQAAQGQENPNAQLGNLISLAQMFSGGGGGGGLGQEVQEAATKKFIQKAFTPDPHEIMGQAMAMKQYKKMADEMGIEVDDSAFEGQMKAMFDFGRDDSDDADEAEESDEDDDAATIIGE